MDRNLVIETIIHTIFNEGLNNGYLPSEIFENTELKNDLNIDSYAFMNLLVNLEINLNINSIDYEKHKNVETIGEFADEIVKAL